MPRLSSPALVRNRRRALCIVHFLREPAGWSDGMDDAWPLFAHRFLDSCYATDFLAPVESRSKWIDTVFASTWLSRVIESYSPNELYNSMANKLFDDWERSFASPGGMMERGNLDDFPPMIVWTALARLPDEYGYFGDVLDTVCRASNTKLLSMMAVMCPTPSASTIRALEESANMHPVDWENVCAVVNMGGRGDAIKALVESAASRPDGSLELVQSMFTPSDEMYEAAAWRCHYNNYRNVLQHVTDKTHWNRAFFHAIDANDAPLAIELAERGVSDVFGVNCIRLVLRENESATKPTLLHVKLVKPILEALQPAPAINLVLGIEKVLDMRFDAPAFDPVRETMMRKMRDHPELEKRAWEYRTCTDDFTMFLFRYAPLSQEFWDHQLHSTAWKSQADLVRLFLDRGANVHVKWEQPLRFACKRGDLEIVKLLVEAGADVHVGNETPIQWAAEHGHTDVVEYLKTQGAVYRQNYPKRPRWLRE